LAARETLQIVCAYSIELLPSVNNKFHKNENFLNSF